MQQVRRSVLLGGIGGDSHSVGLNILRHALAQNGFEVRYLGSQNTLDDFFRFAGGVDAVLVSNMDGHAKHYLRQFPHRLRETPGLGCLWYVGGNLSVGSGLGIEQAFREMGFHRAFVDFVDIETVLETLGRDLAARTPARDTFGVWDGGPAVAADDLVGGSEEALPLGEWEKARPEVLESWKTGHAAADLEENAAYLAQQPSFARLQRRVLDGYDPILVQPRSGVASVKDQIALFNAFKSLGVRVVSYQVDSLTRNNDYLGVAEMIRDAGPYGEQVLNGFPVVNHGVAGLRKVMAHVGLPVQTRHSTRDPRLLAEISYAGGVTAFEGGAICYNLPYYKRYPLSEAIANWQYVDRLTGLYHERFGIVLDREFFGTLTATLIPPSLAIVVNLIQSILAVQQGVRCLSLGYAEQGHRPQDIAALECMREIVTSTLANLGARDVQINTIFCQYMAAFPSVETQAEELITSSGTTAQLGGATRILTKTPVEASRIPSMKDNLHGLSLNMAGIAQAADIEVDRGPVDAEKEVIRREVDAIMERVFTLGHGNLAAGTVRAFAQGAIDIPFSPSLYNRGAALTARDHEGAVRYLNFGEVPFDEDTRAFHRDRMSERRRAEALPDDHHDYLLVEQDVMRIARGQFERWPLHVAETRHRKRR